MNHVGRILLRWLERTLLVIGVVCVSWFSVEIVRVRWYQHQQREALARAIRTNEPPTARPTRLPDDPIPSPRGQAERTRSLEPPPDPATLDDHQASIAETDPNLVGEIEIARVGVSAIVRTGDDAATLRAAVGHIPGSPRPGEPGNVALAGHRDSFFRGLRDVRAGDHVRIVTAHGTYTYRISKAFVVDPADVWVLDAANGNTLTLITCYPFNYVGSAPRRFIVRGDEISSPAPAPLLQVHATSTTSVPLDIELSAPIAKPTALTVAPARAISGKPRRAKPVVAKAHGSPALTAGADGTLDPPAAARQASESGRPPSTSGTKGSIFKRGLGKVFRPLAKIFRPDSRKKRQPAAGSSK